MDTNPRSNSLKNRMILYILLIVALAVFVLSLRDWVAGDIQGRLIPATAILIVPFIILLVIYIIRETSKPQR